MAKKKISMDQLEVGMFMEADIKEGAKGSGSKNVLLLGKGVLITSANQIRRLKEAGLTNVTIDTSKGKDIPGGQVVAAPVQIKEAKKQKPPGGRQTFFREEVKVAKQIRGASVKVVQEFMHNAATGASIDTKKVTLAAKTLTGSIFRNVDALLSLTALKNYSEHTYTHSVNVCVLTLAIAHATGVTEDEATEIGVGGLLHDVGKSIIPLSILDKPGPLTQEERQAIYESSGRERADPEGAGAHHRGGHRDCGPAPREGERQRVSARHHGRADAPLRKHVGRCGRLRRTHVGPSVQARTPSAYRSEGRF
ncbi:MAG: DUF3391 domain-containing protein [Candidatus Latescibacteria bacterium]|jgi:hypothetical protein|nr:DUF3391 domain-containing protein [Candidatus Latescibacterota bacterium]